MQFSANSLLAVKKTNRQYGQLWNSIRDFYSKVPRFSVDDLCQCREITRKQAIENLPQLVRRGELKVVFRGTSGFEWLSGNVKHTVYERI